MKLQYTFETHSTKRPLRSLYILRYIFVILPCNKLTFNDILYTPKGYLYNIIYLKYLHIYNRPLTPVYYSRSLRSISILLSTSRVLLYARVYLLCLVICNIQPLISSCIYRSLPADIWSLPIYYIRTLIFCYTLLSYVQIFLNTRFKLGDFSACYSRLRRSSCILQSSSEVPLSTVEHFFYTVVDLGNFPVDICGLLVYYSQPGKYSCILGWLLRSSCRLLSNYEVFLYTKVNL